MCERQMPGDAEIVARCQQGDGAAWRLLVERYQRLVYAVARRAGLDEHAAADVFQTVFSRLLQSLASLRQPDRLRAWIVTTAKRETLQQLRRARGTVSLTVGDGDADADGGAPSAFDPADPSPLPEELLEHLQQLHGLRSATGRLDARCRGLLELLFADEAERLPYDQIALRLEIPVGSIGPTRARCIAKLRTLLTEELGR